MTPEVVPTATVNGLGGDTVQGLEMSMDELDDKLMAIISTQSQLVVEMATIGRRLDVFTEELRTIHAANATFYRDKDGWPRVTVLEEAVAELKRNVDDLKTTVAGIHTTQTAVTAELGVRMAQPSQGMSAFQAIPGQVKEGLVPAGVTSAILGVLWLIYEAIQAALG